MVNSFLYFLEVYFTQIYIVHVIISAILALFLSFYAMKRFATKTAALELKDQL